MKSKGNMQIHTLNKKSRLNPGHSVAFVYWQDVQSYTSRPKMKVKMYFVCKNKLQEIPLGTMEKGSCHLQSEICILQK